MAITVDSRQARRSGRMPAAVTSRTSSHGSSRARAFAAAQRHSRLVALLRVLCPLAAVGILAVYAGVVGFNWQPGKFDPGETVFTSDDLTMKNPSYFDTTSDGRYEVRARRAIVSFDQSEKKPIKLIDVSGELTQNSGTVTKLKAKHGLFDNAKGELELFDGIEIDGSDGTMARLTRAMIYSKEGKVVSVDPVSATMPTGSVLASAMTMNTKTRLMQFTGGVRVRLVPQQGKTLGAGKDASQPVDVRAQRLDVDDAAKTAHFRGNVVAVQGETTLKAPYLMVKYDGKAAAGPGAATQPAAGATSKAAGGSARVTLLSARDGVEIVAGSDRRIASDRVDFDVPADTALFAGNVALTQDKNVLKGDRLTVDRKAGTGRLEPPDGGGRVVATFHPPDAAPKQRTKRREAAGAARESIMGSFKTDSSAPMTVQAKLLELDDTASKAVFKGDVHASQGDLLLRSAQLTAFYSGTAGLGLSPPGGRTGATAKAEKKTEIVRMKATGSVIMTSKNQSATAKWADFDVKADTALLGGGVVVDRVVKGATDPLKRNIVSGDRLRIDLATGIYRFEAETPPERTAPSRRRAPASASRRRGPAASFNRPGTSGATAEERFKACAPGRQCGVIFPERAKKKALDALKKKAPGSDVR